MTFQCCGCFNNTPQPTIHSTDVLFIRLMRLNEKRSAGNASNADDVCWQRPSVPLKLNRLFLSCSVFISFFLLSHHHHHYHGRRRQSFFFSDCCQGIFQTVTVIHLPFCSFFFRLLRPSSTRNGCRTLLFRLESDGMKCSPAAVHCGRLAESK